MPRNREQYNERMRLYMQKYRKRKNVEHEQTRTHLKESMKILGQFFTTEGQSKNEENKRNSG